MKIHPKTFEDVFTSPRALSKFNVDKVSASDMSLEVYTNLFKKTLSSIFGDLFIAYVRIAWLKKKFRYGKNKIKNRSSGYAEDKGYGVYLRHFVGKDVRVLTRDSLFGKISPFLEELFPAFEEGDPFLYPEDYKFPFDHVNLDFMAVVYQMDERVDLLRHADKEKMSYTKFLDFVINHIYTENEGLKKPKYDFLMPRRCAPYVRKNK